MNTLALVRDGLNPELMIEGVLMTMADFRTNLTTEVIKEIRGYFKDKVYETVIPRNIRLGEAPSHGKPITIYDTHSIGAQRYRQLAKEVLGEDQDILKSLGINNLEDNSAVVEQSEGGESEAFSE
jgi:chromosome partitioning protein